MAASTLIRKVAASTSPLRTKDFCNPALFKNRADRDGPPFFFPKNQQPFRESNDLVKLIHQQTHKHFPMQIVLVEPEIPHNTGAAGRLALATGSTLHLVKPLGFSIDDKTVRRTGLDYWKDVDLKVWENFHDLQQAHPHARFWFLSTKAKKSAWDIQFEPNDFLVFGKETKGLPEEWLDHRALRIPMKAGSTRSLNLATAIAIVLYEAHRQVGDLE